MDNMKKLHPYHKSKKVCIICKECGEKVNGISKAHALAVMKQHKALSKIHKRIVKALAYFNSKSKLQEKK